MRYINSFVEDEQYLQEIRQGIDYAVSEGWLDPDEAKKMTIEEMERWLAEHIR